MNLYSYKKLFIYLLLTSFPLAYAERDKKENTAAKGSLRIPTFARNHIDLVKALKHLVDTHPELSIWQQHHDPTKHFTDAELVKAADTLLDTVPVKPFDPFQGDNLVLNMVATVAPKDRLAQPTSANDDAQHTSAHRLNLLIIWAFRAFSAPLSLSQSSLLLNKKHQQQQKVAPTEHQKIKWCSHAKPDSLRAML